ncbi:MAG: DUF429 domain-containing protein [Aggregatilineaceae bacterium]
MLIFGVDFTSAPCPRKPITAAVSELRDGVLRVQHIEVLTDFAAFESFLQRPGPWVAGFDFPFSQPLQVIRTLGWGESWAEIVAHVGAMSRDEFLAALKTYRDAHPPGDKHPLRPTDALAGARSPLMVHGVPVGRMFWAGAPRLLAAGVSVVPGHPTDDTRVALEVYPALVARRWIGARPYKSDSAARQTTDQHHARCDLLAGLRANCDNHYGFALDLPGDLAEVLISDPSGDRLDALLGAVQAAWASGQPGYGVPSSADPREGWIVDPVTVRASFARFHLVR